MPISGRKKWLLRSILLLGCIGFAAWAKRYYSRHKRASELVTIYAYRLPLGAIFISEDPQNPRLQNYLRHEHLDRVVAPYKTDLDRILALATWTSKQFTATTPFPHYPPWNGQEILNRNRAGKTGGFCAQYAFVFGQACQTMGYIPRYLDLASPESPGGHFTTEVYVPSLKKWIVVEAEFAYYYTDTQGHPLSALELHQWSVGSRTDPVYEYPSHHASDKNWLRLFYYFRYYLRNNFLSVPVFVRHDGEHMGFEPYRVIWSDRYTADTLHLADALPSSNPADFNYAVRSDAILEFTWHQRGDFYKAVTMQPVYQLCKIEIPHSALVRLIKNDLVHDPHYHRLRS